MLSLTTPFLESSPLLFSVFLATPTPPLPSAHTWPMFPKSMLETILSFHNNYIMPGNYEFCFTISTFPQTTPPLVSSLVISHILLPPFFPFPFLQHPFQKNFPLFYHHLPPPLNTSPLLFFQQTNTCVVYDLYLFIPHLFFYPFGSPHWTHFIIRLAYLSWLIITLRTITWY